MGVIKISELVELLSAANSDELIINDISEPLDVDKTKRIKVSNLVKGLSCYGYFSGNNVFNGTATTYTDIPGATTDLTVPVTSTLFAIATGLSTMTDVGNTHIKWVLDGTSGAKIANIGSTNVPIADSFTILSVKTGVTIGVKTCKLQYEVSSGDHANISEIFGFVLGFAE